ncbi:MAG TPA: Gfo/Idh/MocA family oxidoreductase [Acidimicrobiales bacterium]|nr:Gfo/Idh/MocA family oxidoreductase [Acidimicrobiales bacterium]
MPGKPLQLRVAMIGYGFMGAAHSYAWRAASMAFDLGAVPVLAVLCGRDRAAVEHKATRFGFAETAMDWRTVVDRNDVDIVDVCSPGDTHMAITVAALRSGKHVLCEKPLANSVAEAETMAEAAESARSSGQRSMVGFNYRRVPALKLARHLVADGRIGELRHVRGAYLQDWLVDPAVPLAWRMRRELAGSGAIGDIGAHVIDLAQFLTGERLTALSARTRTFVTERPLPSGTAAALGGSGGPGTGEVTVDDAFVLHGEVGAALATFEATRMATGRRNSLRIELNGSAGSLAFDFETMNELSFYDATGPRSTNGFRRIIATEPDHPYMSAWWPPGHGLGYDHTFTNEIADFVRAIVGGTDPEPSLLEGLQVQRALAALESSATNGGAWTVVDRAER